MKISININTPLRELPQDPALASTKRADVLSVGQHLFNPQERAEPKSLQSRLQVLRRERGSLSSSEFKEKIDGYRQEVSKLAEQVEELAFSEAYPIWNDIKGEEL